MFSLPILMLSLSMFSISCDQPQANQDNVTNNNVSTTTAPAEQDVTEISQPIATNKIEDNSETTTELDVKKATPAPLLPTLKSQNATTTVALATNAPTSKTEVVAEKITVVTNTDSDKLIESHETFNGMLQKFVSTSGTVNYAGWKKSESDLDKYLTSLAVAIPTSTTPKNEALAYWINTYNAFTIKLILKNYPVVRITDLSGGKPWDIQWITLAGKKYSLNDIENKVIRPTFKEPRIHFAVNCAAKSCPPLANKAFTAANLNSMLEQGTKAFINSNLNTITASKINLSKIFDWYKEDFGNVISFVNKYATTKVNANATIAYNDYNWALNK